MKMPKKKKKAVVPRLRFPEFLDAGEWEVKRLGEVGKISTGKTPLTGDQDSWNGETPWITPTDINGAKRISNSERKLTKKGAITAGLLPKDAVLVTCIASIGKNAILDVPGSCNQQINAIISKNGFNPDFIFYLIEKNSITMTNLAGGSSPAIIPKREFESLRLPFPDLPEQQKISDCLSSLDDLIRAGEVQLVALKDHKKGLMQQLFPREAETSPRLRFPEFRDAGPWEVKRLGGVAEFLDNMRRPISRFKRKQGTYPYYGASGAIDHIDEYIFDERLLLIGEDGAKWGPFEKTAFIVEGKYWVNNHAHVLRPVASNDVLLENYLNATDVSVYVTGFAPPKLTLDNLKSIRIPISPVQEEQQKIADCLTSLDDLIRAGEAQLVALKDHKKGLMQQLFPQEVG